MDPARTPPPAPRPPQIVQAAALFVLAGLFTGADRITIGAVGGAQWRQFAVLSVFSLSLFFLLPAWMIWRLPRYWSFGRHMVLRVAFSVTALTVLADVLLTSLAVWFAGSGEDNPWNPLSVVDSLCLIAAMYLLRRPAMKQFVASARDSDAGTARPGPSDGPDGSR